MTRTISTPASTSAPLMAPNPRLAVRDSAGYASKSLILLLFWDGVRVHPLGAGDEDGRSVGFRDRCRAGNRADHGSCRGYRTDRGISSDRDGGGDRPGGQAEEPAARAQCIGNGGEPVGDVGGGWRAHGGS